MVDKLTDSELITQLEKELSGPLSEVEKEIALADFHGGVNMKDIVDRLMYGELFDPESLLPELDDAVYYGKAEETYCQIHSEYLSKVEDGNNT